MAQLFALGLSADIDCLVESRMKAREQMALATYLTAGVRTIEGDLATGEVNGLPPSHVDVVFHLAANIDTAATGAQLDVNHRGTEHLLEWLGDCSRGACIVYTSSVAVHDRRGTSHVGPSPKRAHSTPGRNTAGRNCGAEQILEAEAAARGYTYTILRLATVYGRDPKPGGLFDTFARYSADRSLAGRLDWPGRTSIIHADDAAALMI